MGPQAPHAATMVFTPSTAPSTGLWFSSPLSKATDALKSDVGKWATSHVKGKACSTAENMIQAQIRNSLAGATGGATKAFSLAARMVGKDPIGDALDKVTGPVMKKIGC